jgi:hypothetical protein
MHKVVVMLMLLPAQGFTMRIEITATSFANVYSNIAAIVS